MNYIFFKRSIFAISFSAVSIFFLLIMLLLQREMVSAKTASPKAFAAEIEKQISQPHYPLSFKERIDCQEIIEKIYWNHRIWPEENKNTKPAFDSIMPESLLKNKVEDYMKKSNALEYYWNNSITGNQLQAELERMAKSSKNPAVLKEIWNALQNNPHMIAECMARPILADRLIRNWYAFDERFHGATKARIQAEIKEYSTASQMKNMSGRYSEIEYIKSALGKQRLSENHQELIENDEEWNQLLKKHNLHSVKGAISALKENKEQFYIMGVLGKEPDKIIISIVSWEKVPFSVWWEKKQDRFTALIKETPYYFQIPAITASVCLNNSWVATPSAPDARSNHTAIWTGTEMIIWGGYNGETILAAGSKYNPATDTWTDISLTDSPGAIENHSAVWTGTEMIIWGGSMGFPTLSGARYNPATDSWIATSIINAPQGRSFHSAVWTGAEMIVWGGTNTGSTYLNTGGKYNPITDSWIATSTTGAPIGRYWHSAIWSGSEMIIWGGTDDANYFNNGGRYNPSSDVWTATSLINAPEERGYHIGIWTTSEMIIWGGYNVNSGCLNTGSRYNPISDSWNAISNANAPSPRAVHSAIWTDTEMIIWGGYDLVYFLNDGARYNPATDSWANISTVNAPEGRRLHKAVWTGNEMIVWGGDANYYLNTGGRYNAAIDSWLPTATYNAPLERHDHTTIWTGIEMIIWGGYGYWYLNSGAKYNLITDTWADTSTLNVPQARELHTVVWNGEEMIVWGGRNAALINSGGKYNPVSDSWTAVNTNYAPSPRRDHTAIWSNSEMIIWGGYSNAGANENTGGLYNPDSDSWTSTSLINAPLARSYHTAIWSGTEMIIWGGTGVLGNIYNTGGRYNPANDSWIDTETNGAPGARNRHTAVWTGTEMIIWGGEYGSTKFNTGGRYNPVTNSWILFNAPNSIYPRSLHTALWTKNEMIIWGGYGGLLSYSNLNIGGKYYIGSDSWIETSTSHAPTPRSDHSAVWTGNEMIIWGGDNIPTYFNTGGKYCAFENEPPTEVNLITVTKSPGEIINISFSIACNSTDNVIYWGKSTGAFSEINWTGQQCFIGNTGSYSLNTGALNSNELMYFVVVANNGIEEASYGKNSSGVERPEAVGLSQCDFPLNLTGNC